MAHHAQLRLAQEGNRNKDVSDQPATKGLSAQAQTVTAAQAAVHGIGLLLTDS